MIIIIRNFIKNLKIEIILMKLNLETMTEYRFDAVLSFFGSFLYNIGAILFFTFVFDKIPQIYSWDKWDMILLYGVGQWWIFIPIQYTSK